MAEVRPLPKRPEDVMGALVDRFNTGDIDVMMSIYAEGAAFVTNSGEALTDPALIRRELANFMSVGLPMTTDVRHMIVADDIALFLVDWEIKGTGPDGADVHLRGSASDIARRGSDGFWRYVIDNPYGTRFREKI
ncbi:YybH family protein [Streptomyces sp. NPDC018964]|uniref:YybH family protein n=1 Tax=unclassified Streptomyces TaxID=2593676 RepID=UPI00378C8A5F